MKTDVIRKAIEYFPELGNPIEENLMEFPEIYLHLIFGDIFNPYLLGLLESPQQNWAKIVKASELIEYMANMDVGVQEVVVTTVLERLVADCQNFAVFCKLTGKQTQQFIRELGISLEET